MHPNSKADILDVLVKARVFLEIRDFTKLKELSNNTIHDVGIYQSQSAMDTAIAIYAISKLLERQGIKTGYMASLIHDAEHYLEMDKLDQYHDAMAKLLAHIRQLDIKFPMHVQEVLNEAKIRKGSKLFEHGISVAKSAQLFGVSRWDLLPYVGQMSVLEIKTHMDLAKRLSFARSLFK